MNNSMKFLVTKKDDGKRLDIFLSTKIKHLTRSNIKKIIKSGNVKIDKRQTDSASKKVKTNESITITPLIELSNKLIPNKIKLDIRYEDKNVLIVNKPKGMVVHPGANNNENTLANALVHKFKDKLSDINGELRPGIVHRIDKETSGLLVVAKNNLSHSKLAKQFSDHSIKRKYICLVWGVIRPLQGRIETLISRSKKNRQLMTVSEIKGKNAITNYNILKVFNASGIPKIIGITGAMPSGTGLNLFEKKFPDRTFDVGIAEQHAVTFAAGLATEGYKPYAAIYSTFLQRAYDQVVHDVAIQSLPVRFAIDRAGLVGADGPTHAGSFDITYLSTLPNFVVMAASDESELVKMINTSVNINDRPSAFRYPRGNGLGVKIPSINEVLQIGKGRIIKEGKKAAILNFGTRLEECKKASEILLKKGIDLTIIDARFAKPLDEKLIMEVANNHEVLVSIEEGSIGGFGSHVMQFLSDRGVFDRGLKFRSMILPDIFIDQDTPDKMYEMAGLDSSSIVNKIEETLNSNIILANNKNKISY